MCRRQALRRGITTVQMCVMLAVITLAIVGTVRVLGTNSKDKLNQTASDLATPKNLTTRFAK